MQTTHQTRISARHLIAAAITAALLTAGAAACSSGSDPKPTAAGSASGSKGAAATTPAKRDPAANPADPGPCRTALNELMTAGSQLSAASTNKVKIGEALSGVSTRLGADAAKIGDPAAKQGAQDLAALYAKLAQQTKDGVAPDVKDLQSKVQTATAAVGKCASAEG